MPGVGGWLTVGAFFASSKKRPDWKDQAGFFSMKAFLCQLKEKASAEESPHSFSKAERCKPLCREAWFRCRKATASLALQFLLQGIYEPLQVRRRAGFGETTFPAGASPNMRDEVLRTAK